MPPAPLPPAQTALVPPASAQPAPEATQASPASAQREQINQAVPIARWDEPGGGDLNDEIPFGPTCSERGTTVSTTHDDPRRRLNLPGSPGVHYTSQVPQPEDRSC